MTSAALNFAPMDAAALPLGRTLGLVAESMSETATLVDAYEGHVSALIQTLSTLPDSIEHLQHLDRISQTLRGLATIIARAGEAVPPDASVHRDTLFAGIGLGALTERVEGGEISDPSFSDAGDFEAF